VESSNKLTAEWKYQAAFIHRPSIEGRMWARTPPSWFQFLAGTAADALPPVGHSFLAFSFFPSQPKKIDLSGFFIAKKKGLSGFRQPIERRVHPAMEMTWVHVTLVGNAFSKCYKILK
jgi:hypothetical protein